MDLWSTLQVTLLSSLVVSFKSGGSVSINSAIFSVTFPATTCWTTVLTWGERRLWPFLFAPLSIASLPCRVSGFRLFSRAFRCLFSSYAGAFEVPVWSPSRLNLSFAGFISHLVPLLFGVCYIVSARVSIVGGCFFPSTFGSRRTKILPATLLIIGRFPGLFLAFSGTAFGAFFVRFWCRFRGLSACFSLLGRFQALSCAFLFSILIIFVFEIYL